MTCRQLGGACDLEFSANSFEEMAEISKQHAVEMSKLGDNAHIDAMSKMQELMKSPQTMQIWFENKRIEFEALPDV